MSQKGFGPILIVILIALAVGGYLLYQKQNDQNQSNISSSRKEITGICDSEVRYKTQLLVRDNSGAQKAFQMYIDFMKANKMQDNNLAVDWFFTNAEDVGYYKNTRYWIITFSYLMNEGSKGNAQSYVNQNGEIVDLRGCI